MTDDRRYEQLAVYSPTIKRWRAACPHCNFVVKRAKREAAEHVLRQHVAYEHGR